MAFAANSALQAVSVSDLHLRNLHFCICEKKDNPETPEDPNICVDDARRTSEFPKVFGAMTQQDDAAILHCEDSETSQMT